MRSDVEFCSEERTLRGWLYRPDVRADASAAVVMAHGFSAVKEQYLDRYAEVFQAAGLGVLVYDHAHFGASEGLPRQEVDPVSQKRGYRDAISFAETIPWIDHTRIGIWGTSYSGGHVIEVAAIDRRVRCVVAQVPSISGSLSARRRTRSDLVPAQLRRFEADRAARFRGEEPALLPAVSDDPLQSCAMPGPDGHAFFTGTRAFAPSWRNEVTLRSAELSRENEAGVHIARISPTPLLMIVAEDDVLTAADLCLEAYQRALPPKDLVMVPGGHFDPYLRNFDRTSKAARDFFVVHLGAGAAV
ncbi:alpha/beta hydrolase [Methylobacterium sp. J-077]|uniref:alpha/beta hydrolase n=1 Tax=Methylobacterium sp. J-077 TaxID=2836656 RepID=UPI001FBBD386|nr:alpha/beta hydrolase [Methylobacterium sp. J-077]MCJ2124246.1 alpha/beta hydrolase [Methylobacterium sp. J-077]